MGMMRSGQRDRRRSRKVQSTYNISTPARRTRVSRTSLLAGASLAALAVLGEPGAAWGACTPSTQTISTAVTGPILANGGSILVTGGGSIAGGAEGVFAENCSITTLSNNGSIGAASGAPGDAGGIGVLNNSGEAINLFSNTANGTIRGGKAVAGLSAERAARESPISARSRSSRTRGR
jgi:hypothetical protein